MGRKVTLYLPALAGSSDFPAQGGRERTVLFRTPGGIYVRDGDSYRGYVALDDGNARRLIAGPQDVSSGRAYRVGGTERVIRVRLNLKDGRRVDVSAGVAVEKRLGFDQAIAILTQSGQAHAARERANILQQAKEADIADADYREKLGFSHALEEQVDEYGNLAREGLDAIAKGAKRGLMFSGVTMALLLGGVGLILYRLAGNPAVGDAVKTAAAARTGNLLGAAGHASEGFAKHKQRKQDALDGVKARANALIEAYEEDGLSEDDYSELLGCLEALDELEN